MREKKKLYEINPRHAIENVHDFSFRDSEWKIVRKLKSHFPNFSVSINWRIALAVQKEWFGWMSACAIFKRMSHENWKICRLIINIICVSSKCDCDGGQRDRSGIVLQFTSLKLNFGCDLIDSARWSVESNSSCPYVYRSLHIFLYLNYTL